MNTTQIESVRVSFAKLEPIASTAAALFYENLFIADPSLRTLFRGDMSAQGARLMEMIGSAVKLLDRPETLLPVLRALGMRHVRYGVRRTHYLTVGSALLSTLRQGLGDDFTEEVRQAWTEAYALISRTMIEAAATVDAPGECRSERPVTT